MKNKILLQGLLVAVFTLSFACSQKSGVPPVDKEQVKAEIQALEDNFALIYNTRNPDSISYYADDAISYLVGRKPAIGKKAIHDHIVNELVDFPVGGKIQNETLEIYISDDGNHVAEIGAYKLVDSTGTLLLNGNYFSFFVKRDGKFVCIRDMASSYPVEE